jgi:hypothetical protein
MRILALSVTYTYSQGLCRRKPCTCIHTTCHHQGLLGEGREVSAGEPRVARRKHLVSAHTYNMSYNLIYAARKCVRALVRALV